MARREVVLMTDDLTGEEIKQDESETVRFSLDRTEYEIDLSKPNAGKLRDELARYIDAGRKVGGGRARRGGGYRVAKRNAEQIRAIREWARAHGHKVSDRGRISAEVQRAYDEANR
jgi:Lsr2